MNSDRELGEGSSEDAAPGPFLPEAPGAASELRLSAAAAVLIRREIQRAGGREVCFLAGVSPGRELVEPRAVARGNEAAVLAAARAAEEGSIMVHNHPSGVLEPSDADLDVAARLYEDGLGSAITDNEAARLYVVVEPPPPRSLEPLDVEALEGLIGPRGRLAEKHPRYEDRPGQGEMLRIVAGLFNDGGVGIVEAGTGTGKSLAYLIPSTAWATENAERVIVSTNTINLQEQLDGRDLPLVRSLLGEEVDWALVKGRGNYISIRRARLAADAAPLLFEADRADELDALLSWIDETGDGSLADLTFRPSREVWDEVRSDSDICLKARCPHFQACFYQRARRRAARARLLVANHHLLFADLSVRIATRNFSGPAVLPAYRHLILDEAHNVEDAATSHLGLETTRTGIFRLLARLDRRGRGVLAAVQEALTEEGRGRLSATQLRGRIEERVRPAVDEARSQLTRFFDVMEPLLRADTAGATRIGTPELPEPGHTPAVKERLDGLVFGLRALEAEVRHTSEALERDELLREGLQGRILDLRSAERQLSRAVRTLQTVLDPGEEERNRIVRWLEWRGRGRKGRGNLAMAAAPIELGTALREGLFEKTDTVVLTSATLASNNSLAFLRGRIGLSEEELEASERLREIKESIIPSPFNFQEQTVLAIPTDLPGVNAPGDALQGETVRIVRELAAISDGGLFVLFTSYRALRRVAELLRRSGGLAWPLLVQGEEDRTRLLDHFVAAGSAILLGTASFWEGVDVPGQPLRGLIIQRIPFRVPTEPVTAARVEAIEKRGGNAFWDYSLPLAALRLKQGFGRLVRSRDDRGGVVILDDRILRKRYGAYLRGSLPPAPLLKGPWGELTPALRRFYRAGGGSS